MITCKSNLFKGAVAVLAAIPIVAATTFTPGGSAEAAILRGSIGLGGQALVPDNGVNPLNTSIGFVNVDGVNAHGDFGNFIPTLSPNPSTPLIQISTLNLTRSSVDGPARATYSTGAVPTFIDFGERTLDGITGLLTFDLDDSFIERSRLASKFIFYGAFDGIKGAFNFNGQTVAKGFLSASVSGEANRYEITLTTVPEPATLLGLGIVAAGMAVSRRRNKTIPS
ncbi:MULTISPECIES: PEP-CTERM sorting domain-containing protein [unclassified Anabaena]|uniref:PEP-CTERM sorting domain-containing protein n=1 Tax=unclassified Anabaena TaxID=2619674 RepID=UPI0039C6B6A9